MGTPATRVMLEWECGSESYRILETNGENLILQRCLGGDPNKTTSRWSPLTTPLGGLLVTEAKTLKKELENNRMVIADMDSEFYGDATEDITLEEELRDADERRGATGDEWDEWRNFAGEDWT